MRKWIIALAVVALTCGAHEVYAQLQLRQLMANKLQHAQKLLAAITSAKFDEVREHGDQLLQIANRAEWVAYKTPRYEQHSNEFRRAVETMVRKAKNKNIDGVTLAYMDMTMSCVRCHEHVREVRDAALPRPFPPIALAPPGNR
jgi:hypothetical protein